jgi:peroxiredoxin
MASTSAKIPIGTLAPPFTLPRADGSGEVSLGDYASAPGLLIAFLCVHCPYVKNLEDEFAEFAREYEAKGLAIVGISCNDAEAYPDDAPEQMVAQAKRAGFAFPYLYDESQEVGHAYKATCTPDFYLYDKAQKLAYRGQFDVSRPSNNLVPTGEDLRVAADLVLAGRRVPEPHGASVGCSIKWKQDYVPVSFGTAD